MLNCHSPETNKQAGAAIVFGLLGVLLLAGCRHTQESSIPATVPASESKNPPSVPAAPTAKWTTSWTPLFNTDALTNWKVTEFGGAGEVTISNGVVEIGMGVELTGINWTNGPLPKSKYELSLEAMRVDGSDFFCGLTFPVADSFCSLIVGGWGGSVVGISSVDNLDASENETTKTHYFEANRWYPIRVRVTDDKIQAWVDEEKMIDLVTTGRKISMRLGEIERAVPLGYSTWMTTAAVRNFKLKLIQQ